MREPVAGGGLHLPAALGTADSTAQEAELRWNTIASVEARLKALGLPPNDMPETQYIPVTAEALVSAKMEEFTRLFQNQLRWYGYATRMLADIRALLLQYENELDDIKVMKKRELRTLNENRAKADKMSVAEMDEVIKTDHYYRTLRVEAQHLEQEKIKVEAWVEELDRSLKTVSRQIENRRTELQGGDREGNMPGHASGRWTGPQGGVRTPGPPMPGPYTR